MKKLTTLDILQHGPDGGFYEILKVSETGRVLTVRWLKLEKRGESWYAVRDESEDIRKAHYNKPENGYYNKKRKRLPRDWESYLMHLPHPRHGRYSIRLEHTGAPMVEDRSTGRWSPVTVER